MNNARRNSALAALLLSMMLGAAVVHADLMTEVGRLLYPSTLAHSGVATFDSGSGLLTVTGNPFRTHFPTFVRQHAADPAGSLQIGALVLNPSGANATGAGSPAFQMSGAFDVDGNGSVDPGESGVMLTGDFVELGSINVAAGGSATDGLGFRFRVTGGFLAPFYAGRNIGVDVPMTSATGFPEPGAPNQNFAQSFTAALSTITVKPIDCGTQIGDFVWYDTDGDGIQEPGEPGINGVRVWLKSADGTILATAVTGRGPFNQGGYYLFERLAGFCAGTYQIEVDPSTVPDGFYPSPINAPGSDAATDSDASPATVTLATDIAVNHTNDFGFTAVFHGKVGGVVWHDVDGNGLRDAGEPGIEGVRINVYDGANALAGTTTSVAAGYDISGLSPGAFRVEVDPTTLPAGLVPTTPFAGPPEIDSDGSPAFITLTGQSPSARDIGFGYIGTCVGSIGDLVWYDRNQNGTQDPDEPGLASIRVGLVKADGTPVATTSTNTDGKYTFGALCAGSYRVVIDPADLPAGFTSTIVQHKPAGTALDNNGSPADVVLATDSSTDDTIDLGYVAPCKGAIGDRVWRDQNRNGIQDEGEGGFAGVTINLRRRSDNTIIQSDVSDATGAYRFDGLCPGDYVIEMVPPEGATVSPTLKGDPAVDSDLNPTKIRLLFDNSQDLTIDFGLFADGGIGDLVWRDDDGDGVQDEDEPGLGGVTLTLTNAQGQATTTTTDSSGRYFFPIGLAGVYTVTVTPPAGFGGLTQSGAGGNPAADSNPSPATVVLPQNYSSDFTIDFGILKEITTPPTPGISVVKTANKTTVVFGEAVTFTYVVTNTGTMPLTNVVAVDDNATPGYRYDDFTVGTIASLAPGAKATFTATRVPPMKMCSNDGGYNRKCGMIIVQHFASWVKFIYLQSKDHRDDYRDGSGWWGGRSYSRKAKFRVSDKNGLFEQSADGAMGDGDDNDEYVNSFSVNVDKSFVSKPDGSVSVPRVYHKKGWDSNWRDDWDHRGNDYSRNRWWDENRWGHNNDDDYDYDRHPKQCPTVSTNIVTVTAKAGTIKVTATDKETVQVVAPAPQAPYKTFTIGGWGAKPSGNNPGKFLADNFATVYPTGVTVGGTKTLKLTSASAVEKFLPQTGSPAKLTQNYINPTWNVSSFAGQVLALKLNVDFSAASLTRQGLGSLTVVSGDLGGKTVTQVLTLANTVLGGGSLPSGLSLSELHEVVTKINENFDGGTQNNGYLR